MAESITHFAVKSIGLSRVNGRKTCTLLEASRHNLREIQAEQGAKGHIDPTRTRFNSVLHGPETAAEVQAHAKALLEESGINVGKLRRDYCQAIEAVFSLPQDTAIHDDAAYFAQCFAWLASVFALPVLSAVVHRDESAPHLHVLLLPIQDGVHVGGAPIARVALKRLRESFFTKVAGPAGLKRTGAKLRGEVKQWALDTVIRHCEESGRAAACGALWQVLVAAIKHDPLPAMKALGIDVNDIRPTEKKPQSTPQQNPIGIESNPIGFQKESIEKQSLSCVGFANSTHSKQHPHALKSLADLWDVVGVRSQWKAPCLSRLGKARKAQQHAIDLHRNKLPKPMHPPSVRDDGDGITRVRDEYAHDVSAWE